ncbi:hypothetical protein Lal_00041726 [Lupinus albus]|nr:hypothetical protein Lal_00041726 [Lupinus albus]
MFFRVFRVRVTRNPTGSGMVSLFPTPLNSGSAQTRPRSTPLPFLAEVYNIGLTFATVREAGHEVPRYQPRRALSLIMHFLKGTPLPTTKIQP